MMVMNINHHNMKTMHAWFSGDNGNRTRHNLRARKNRHLGTCVPKKKDMSLYSESNRDRLLTEQLH